MPIDESVEIKPSRRGVNSAKVTVQPTRLPQNVQGQNRAGAGRTPLPASARRYVPGMGDR